ncbi:hypothetical protein P7H06_15645 [Paenibacillus larvae]|nr:phage tail domain-containing protein [Paenibacillus larvae]MDT2260654.1 hypothetical protein [Paenibacillus larvae]
MSGFTFNEEPFLGEYFIVNRVGRTMLPNISPKLLTIPNRPGAYDFGSEIGMREFSVDVTIIQTSPGLLVSMLIISDWLCTDKAAHSCLTMNPAKRITPFQGYTDRYACLDGYQYNRHLRTHMRMALKDAYLDHQALLQTQGLADTYPVITAKFTKSSSMFAIGNGKQNVILLAPTIGKPTVPQPEVVYMRMSYNVGRMADGK